MDARKVHDIMPSTGSSNSSAGSVSMSLAGVQTPLLTLPCTLLCMASSTCNTKVLGMTYF